MSNLYEWCKDVAGCDFNHCSLCESVYKLATKAAEARFTSTNTGMGAIALADRVFDIVNHGIEMKYGVAAITELIMVGIAQLHHT